MERVRVQNLASPLPVRLGVSFFGLLVVFWLSVLTASPGNSGELSEEISLPKDFRATMVHLGSWFVPEGGASGFHDVYADRMAVEAYRKTGQFPDGAILVKELRAHASGNYTTGVGVSRAIPGDEGLKQWFVMVKDATNRHADRPEWGDGWGWALFQKDDPTKNVVTDYKVDCLGCHVPAQSNDWIYVEGYPTLEKP